MSIDKNGDVWYNTITMKDANTLTDLTLAAKRANYAYRIGTPLMTDTEYDNIMDEIRGMMAEEEYSEFRNTLMEDSGKIKHPYAMGSLDKIKAYDSTFSISKWILSNIPNTDEESDGIFISSKIDGCSCRLTYLDGKLVGACTRGKGEYGVDILEKSVNFAPATLNHRFSGDIRGEITLTHESIVELSEFNGKTYKNLRNATAGLIVGKDVTADEASFLRFFPYEIMGNTGMTKLEQFIKLQSLGFETALYEKLTDIFNPSFDYETTAIDDVLMKVYNEFCEKAPFDIDGLVVSNLNDHDVFENKMIPERTVAVKFNQMTADTRLIDVTWQVSKSGRLSPVGIVETVTLGGAEVSNVTLNNLRIMREQGIKYGCTVTMLKSGDVIPKIVGVKHPDVENETEIELPKLCPSCGKPLYYDEDSLFPMCANKDCDDIVHAKILHFLKQLGIKHVSLKTIAKFNLRSISDLVELKPDGGAVKSRFHDDLGKLMFGASREKLLSSFDYDGVSSRIIEKLISHYGFDKLTTSTFDELSKDKPHGIGDKFLKTFCDGFDEVRNEFENILSNERYYGNSTSSKSMSDNVHSGILQGKSFVVTGALETMSREGFKEMVIANGGVYQSSVTKKTNYLVCNDVSTATTKVNKAKSLGVMVINESKFANMLRDGEDGFSMF